MIHRSNAKKKNIQEDEYVGKHKGILQILYERGLFNTKMRGRQSAADVMWQSL